MAEELCDMPECKAPLGADSKFDRYYKKRVCGSCFEKMFREAEINGHGEWYEKNYNKTDYPPEFWRKVGAFVDLSQIENKAYK